MRPIYHAITPGDHYSPATGSAIPTVVHGLVQGALTHGDSERWRQVVVLDASTYAERYGDCAVIEYSGSPRPAPRAWAVDRIRGRAGLTRRAEADYYAPLARALADAEPGIVIAHNALTLPRALDRERHASVVYAHNELPRSMSTRELDRLLGPASAIVCVSTALADATADRLPKRLRDRVRVVANGADVVRFFPAHSGPTLPTVLFVGRTISEKGPDVLLRAAARLPEGSTEIRIVGSHGFDAAAPLTSYERTLRDLASAAPVPVTFTPFVDRHHLPQLLREAAILVVPSRWREPSALTANEGLATGLAVVVSDIGGIPEVVGDAGVTVPPDDPTALTNALTTLLENRAVRQDLGKRARERALERDWGYSWLNLRNVLEEVENSL